MIQVATVSFSTTVFKYIYKIFVITIIDNDSSRLYDHDSYCLTVYEWYHNNDTSTVYSSDI